MKKTVLSNSAPTPVGSYSQGILASGNFLFISGQIGLNADGIFAGDDIVSQTEQVCLNIKSILEAAGMSFENVVKTNVFLVNMDDFGIMNEIYSKFFNVSKPARATVVSPQLPKGALIEIEAIAVL